MAGQTDDKAWTPLTRAQWMEIHLTAILNSADAASYPVEELARLRHHAACLQEQVKDLPAKSELLEVCKQLLARSRQDGPNANDVIISGLWRTRFETAIAQAEGRR